MPRDYYVYILTNKASMVLYTGVTNDLERRVYEHRTNALRGFTSRYGVHRFYFEAGGDIGSAIEREKAIKGGSRKRKMALVDDFNPTWRDLYEDI